MMPTVSDLGRKLKEKHPNKFGNMSEAEAGRQAKREFPDAYGHYTDESITVNQTQNIQPVRPQGQQLEKKVQELWNKHDPQMGVLVSWWKRRKVEGQNKFLEYANQQERQLIEQAVIISDFIAAGKRGEEEFRRFLWENYTEIEKLKVAVQLMQDAAQNGLSMESYIALKEEEFRAKIRTKEFKKKTEIELDNRWKEIVQDLNAADMEAIATRLVIKKMRDELIESRKERRRIELEEQDAELKILLLEDYTNYINNLVNQINATETRLLQEARR